MVNPTISHLKTIFQKALETKNLPQIQSIGLKLTQYYFNQQEFSVALEYALTTEKALAEKSPIQLLNLLGQTYLTLGQLISAKNYFDKSLALTQTTSEPKWESTILNNLSQIYGLQGKYDLGLKTLEKALKVQQEIGDKKGLGSTYNNLSQIYKYRGDHTQALFFLEKSLQIRIETNSLKGQGTVLNNMGTTYLEMGGL
jgi:tetratricopeptide (TPR) repeat protein